jgi:hypothetical protein
MSRLSPAEQQQIFEEGLNMTQSHLKFVDDAVGKDIVLFLGGSQNGKNATINACCGVRFDWEIPDPTPDNPYPAQEEPISDPQSTLLVPIGSGGPPQTKFPVVDSGPLSNLVFVDSRGIGEVGGSADRAGILASSILTERICRVAKSIRIVVIARFANLKTISNLNPVIEQIASLLINSQVPILWVFNDNEKVAHPLTSKEFTKAMRFNASYIE